MLSRILEDFATSVWVERVGWTLLHSLWQILLVVSIYYLLSFLLRKNSAFSRYIIGCTALVAMLVAPLATFCLLPNQQVAVARVVDQESDEVSPSLLNDISISPNTIEPRFTEPGALADNSIGVETGALEPEVYLPSAHVDPTAEPVEVPSEIEKIASAMRPWLPLITVSWLVGVVLLSMRPVVGSFYVRRLKRFGLTPVPDFVLDACHELMRKMKIHHAVQLFQSSLVHSPVVVGYLRPMILLPASAITGLTASQLELILAHELAHIRKHDYLVNFVQTLIEALLFYHPGMWWLSREVRRERENCCDDAAVAIGSDRATYIRALALLEQQRVAPPALAATGGSLLNRVRRLVGEPGSEFVYRKSSLWLTVLLMVGIAFTAITFAGAASDRPDKVENSVENEDGEEAGEVNSDSLTGQKGAHAVAVDLFVYNLRWDRLKPDNEHARVLREWDDIDYYEEARAIGINKTSDLPEIWVAVPKGSKAYEIRNDVRVTNATLDTTIYERPDLNQFWVQRDKVGSSFRTFFGPFDGDPFQVLGIQVNHAENRIVGEWVGGGAIMPVFHTFSANGIYEKRIGERTADPERGAWQLEDNLLTRQFDGQEDSTHPIEWIDQNAFRIELPNDKSAVYRRFDEKTGNVILPEVSEGNNPITAAENFADELLLIISKERGGQISPGGIGYSLDHEFLTIDQLQQSLKEKLEANPTRELLVRADPEVPYQMVVVALQLAKAAGVKNVRIASQVIDVQNYQDGGTTAFILHRPDQKPIRVCFDYRDRLPVEGSSWKIAGNLTLGRMFSGADYPANPNAQLVGIGSKEEKRLLSGLNEWLDQQLSKELQTRMLSEARSAESLKRLAATMGKTVDELRELSSLLRKTRQYELVFVQSNGVYVTLQRQAEPQANPSRIPQFLISVVNRGEIEKLTLGRTDQAFELEVDGKWYRQVRFEYKSSPLPPGRIYESFPLTLDQRWLHDGTPLELSPGRHTIRVRCSVHPFGSDKDASLATSQPMTVIVGPEKEEREAKPDPGT